MTDAPLVGSQDSPPRRARWAFPFFAAALAAVSLAWLPAMRHPTYIRQVLLVALAAPAGLAAALLVLGPTRAALGSALAAWPARLYLAAAWGQALLAWASLAWTSNVEATLPRAVELTALAVWGTAWLLAASGRLWRDLAGAHLLVGLLAALAGCAWYGVQAAGGQAPVRLAEPIGNPNTVAVLMFFPLLGAAALLTAGARSMSRSQRLMAAIFGLLALAAFWLAGSRSGLAGLAAGALALAGVRLRPRWLPVLAAAALAALAAGAFWFAASPERVRRAEEQVRLTSVGARYYGALASWSIFKERPVAGAGAGTFLAEAPAHLPRERYLGSYREHLLNLAHNEYAQTAAELGLLGLAALAALFGSALWGASRAARGAPDGQTRALAAGLAAAVAAVAASSLADPSLRLWDFTGFFYAAAALAAGAHRGAQGSGFGVGELAPAVAAGALPATDQQPPATSPRRAVVAGCALLAILASLLWAVPDAWREMSFANAHELFFKQDKPEAALPWYQDAAEVRGDFAARVQAGIEWLDALHRAGKAEQARAEAERLARAVPDCPPILGRLAAARLDGGDRAGALSALIQSGRRDPFSRGLYARMVRVIEAEPAPGRPALLAAVAATMSLSAGGRAALDSLAAAARGDWAGAVAAVEGLAPEAVGFMALDLWRAFCLLAADRPAQAAAALGRHLARVPHHAEGWRLLAAAELAARDRAGLEPALAALRRCIELDVEADLARLELADLLIANGRWAEARAALEPRLAASRLKADFALRLATIARAQGRPDQARAVLERILGQTNDPRLRKALEETGSPEK